MLQAYKKDTKARAAFGASARGSPWAVPSHISPAPWRSIVRRIARGLAAALAPGAPIAYGRFSAALGDAANRTPRPAPPARPFRGPRRDRGRLARSPSRGSARARPARRPYRGRRGGTQALDAVLGASPPRLARLGSFASSRATRSRRPAACGSSGAGRPPPGTACDRERAPGRARGSSGDRARRRAHPRTRGPPPPGKPGRREQLDPGISLAVLLHEEVPVQRTRRHDKPDRTQLIERSSKLAAERRGRVDQQAAGAKPDDRHVPAHLHPKESERNPHDPQAAVPARSA
jgi:hypothetical protein